MDGTRNTSIAREISIWDLERWLQYPLPHQQKNEAWGVEIEQLVVCKPPGVSTVLANDFSHDATG